MTECTCPICPLIKANVQTCNVIVQMTDKGYNIMPQTANEFHKQWAGLVRNAMATKLRINRNWTHNGADHECNVKRLSKEIYQVCFHTLKTTCEDHHDMD